MREMTATLADKEITLVANYRASKKIADLVADPIFIARELGMEAAMAEQGLSYEPKFTWDTTNIPKLLWIGMNEHREISQYKVNDLVFSAGFGAARDVVVEYLGLIIGPGPTEGTEGEADTDSEK